MRIELSFPGEPKAVQSFRFARLPDGQMRKYQPSDTIEWKNYLRYETNRQLPESFQLFEKWAKVEVKFIFAPLKSWPKRKIHDVHNGVEFPKTTKPDLMDNLCKGLNDALNGVVWSDDAIICASKSEKVYGCKPCIQLTVEGE